MKPLNKRVIITQEKRINDTVKVGNKDFILDSAFRTAWNTIQEGIVHSVSSGCDLQPGDRVYVHHFVSEQEHKLPIEGGLYSWLEYSQIYSRIRDGKMKMLNNYLFVEPIRFDNTRFFNDINGFIAHTKSGGEYVERIGIARHISEACKEAGITEGDTILFGKDCEYQIDIDGHKLYRMELRDVITVLDDNVKITAIK